MRASAIENEGEEDQALEDHGDRLVTQLLDRVKGVAQQCRVGREHHQEKARKQQAVQVTDRQHGGQNGESDHRHQQTKRHHVAEVPLDLVVVPRAFADEKDVEAEIQHDADDRRDVDQHGERAVTIRRQRVDHVEDRRQGDQARDDLRRENDDRVAKGPRAEPQACGRRDVC